MSLVERALKKIQESRGSVPPPVQVPAAPVLATPHSHAGPPTVRLNSDPVPALPREAPQPVVPQRILHVDRAALRTATILPPQHQERQLADEYRQIKRPLISSALGRNNSEKLPNGHLIMMASALPGDGKTFTAINLALSMAQEKDLSVLLVDADVAKPHISEIFGVTQDRGLLDVLRDESLDIDSAILPTDVPRLSVLPAGKHSDTAADLLASVRMHQVIASLGARDPNRIVLFDSPPLLLTSESRSLAMVMGQIVLVVRAGATSQQAVLDALDLLGEGKSVSLVLNQSDEQNRAGYYQYYGHIDGSKADEAAESARD